MEFWLCRASFVAYMNFTDTSILIGQSYILVVLSASLCQHPYEGSSQEFPWPIEWTLGVGLGHKRQEHTTVAHQTTKLRTLRETRVIQWYWQIYDYSMQVIDDVNTTNLGTIQTHAARQSISEYV